jgi:DnaA family protein
MTESEKSAQLTLAVLPQDDASFDNFYVTDDNKALVSVLKAWPQQPETVVYLYGQAGQGRSHLLQASCQWFIKQQCQVQYFSLGRLLEYPPAAVLEGLEASDLICLDDLEAVAGNTEWEEALFHLFNRVRENAGRILIASQLPPRELPLELEDLRSRLQWGPLFRLQPCDEQGLSEILRSRAEARGLTMPDDVLQFLILRLPRLPGAVIAALDTLDQASLQHGRKLTVPFVKSVLHL